MTYPQDPATPRPLTALPADPPPQRPRASLWVSLWGGLFSTAFFIIFLASFSLNALILVLAFTISDNETTLRKHHHSGKKGAADKIALVRVDGLLMEGLINYAQKQIDEAAEDSNVKAVVLRINSPAGSITASDDLN